MIKLLKSSFIKETLINMQIAESGITSVSIKVIIKSSPRGLLFHAYSNESRSISESRSLSDASSSAVSVTPLPILE